MKKIVFIFSLCCMVIAWTGCDEILNVTPETDFTDDNFWKSETHLKGACHRLYQQFSIDLNDGRGDDQVSGSSNSISNGSRPIPPTASDWTAPYASIFTANNIIEKGANAPVNESIRNRYIGEARFFRAWWYFNLVCKYGDVPLVLKAFSSTTDPDLKMGRTPRETVIQQCYEDLEFAAAWLPTRAAMQSVTNEFDRRFVTRSAALALLVRIGLHEGTMMKYHNLGSETLWKAHLQQSINAYNSLKTEGHQLYTASGTSLSYQVLFFDEDNNTNREVIFSKAYGPNRTTGANTITHTYTGMLNSTFGITRSMVDYYLYADGLPREKSNLVVTPETSFNHVFGYESDGITPIAGGMGVRDPRLTMTFWRFNDPQDTPTTRVGGYLIGYQGAGRTSYQPDPATSAPPYNIKKRYIGEFSSGGTNTMDWVIIRWGEMLISYAEALYEFNGSITDAQLDETVNALRTRVGFNVALTNGFVTANGLNMREEIRRERTVELMAECLRYTDIIRWKIAETVLPKAKVSFKFIQDDTYLGMNLVNDASFTANLTDAAGKIDGVQEYDYPEANIFIKERASTRRFDPAKDYYYPIPVYEIGQSEGNIVQNPGWR